MSGIGVPEGPAWVLGKVEEKLPPLGVSLGTYAGAGIFPLLPDQDVQRVVLLQVEDAQHRHAVGPHHGVLPTFATSRPIAGDAATGQSAWAPAVGCEDRLPPCPPHISQQAEHTALVLEGCPLHQPMRLARRVLCLLPGEGRQVQRGTGHCLIHRARRIRN